jgi:hypothetical protein
MPKRRTKLLKRATTTPNLQLGCATTAPTYSAARSTDEEEDPKRPEAGDATDWLAAEKINDGLRKLQSAGLMNMPEF